MGEIQPNSIGASLQQEAGGRFEQGQEQQQQQQQQQQEQQQQEQQQPQTPTVDDIDGIPIPVNQKELTVRMVNTGSLSGLYGMMLCSVAFVLTLALGLTNQEPHPLRGLTLFMFHMYVYIVASLFLIFLEISIYRFKRKRRHESTQSKPINKTEEGEQRSRSSFHQDGDNKKRLSHEGIQEREPSSEVIGAEVDSGRTQEGILSYEETLKRFKYFPAFQFTGEGANLFARMGLVAFGLCAVLLETFGLALLIDPKWDGFLEDRVTTALSLVAMILFTFLQTFSLLKNHKMLINYKHMVVKFGLLHVAAANICTWILALVIEAEHSLKEDPSHSGNQPIVLNHTANYTSPFLSGDNSLYDITSPYLFPFVIEFSLLAAALFWKLYSNIGMTTSQFARKGKRRFHMKYIRRCWRLGLGIGLGLVLLVGTMVSMCFFLYLNSGDHIKGIPARIYLITDITVNMISLVATVPAFYQFHKLCFTGTIEKTLDQNLLLIALGGFYILFGFIGFGAASHVRDSDVNNSRAKLQLTSSIITSVQATLQTIFIIDAQYRKATSRSHMALKPGRSVVTFLLIANLAMWLINVFQLKEMDTADIFSETFGKLAWKIVLNIFLPLAVFYRFHASVCLSEIWGKTYSQEDHHSVHILSLVNSADTKQH